MKSGSALQTATRWMCFIASVLTVVLGIVHLIDKSPRLKWPDGSFHDDATNMQRWRFQLFTFSPNVFVDSWTPLVLGLAGTAAHFEGVGGGVGFLTKDFLTTAIFQLICALFANLAYNGGLGILFSIVAFAASLFGFVTAFSDEDSASLEVAVLSR
eukprot:Gregarina_sp_Poly_1__993@NODE_1241_length_4666_cov_269_446184_g846_i0_p3_GENE_NODE_1241_length_4666_cov_269_446184_g846_i0NODE_1241_length_4666_cov_269_446184_g846_i0_p3_ORF_typecomplete_len156_score15_50COPI_assoc/PF08507_10/2_1COPI_assoc/PF08507_10/51_NODE_1241_length_4666_cov_269_446184_g846_i0513980